MPSRAPEKKIGEPTLRQAIADSSPGDTILIALDDDSTLTLTNGNP